MDFGFHVRNEDKSWISHKSRVTCGTQLLDWAKQGYAIVYNNDLGQIKGSCKYCLTKSKALQLSPNTLTSIQAGIRPTITYCRTACAKASKSVRKNRLEMFCVRVNYKDLIN